MFLVIRHSHIGQFVSESWIIFDVFRCKLSYFLSFVNSRNPFVYRDVAVQHLVT